MQPIRWPLITGSSGGVSLTGLRLASVPGMRAGSCQSVGRNAWAQPRQICGQVSAESASGILVRAVQVPVVSWPISGLMICHAGLAA